MIPLIDEIEGFGPHVNTRVDWSHAGNVIGVCGHNGAGKSFLIDNPYAAMYGEYPLRGSLASALTHGRTEGRLMTRVIHLGRTYEIERFVRIAANGAQRQTAFVYLVENGERVLPALAGPKVRDVQAFIEDLFGSSEVALSTWHASQGGRGDITMVPTGEQRRIIAEIIQLPEFEKKRERYAKAMDKVSAKAEVLESQVAGAVDYEAVIERAIGELETARGDLESVYRPELRRIESELSSKKDSLRDSESGEQELKAVIERHEQAAAKVQSVENRIAEMDKEIADWKRKAADLEQARTDFDALEGYRSLMTALKSRDAAWEFWREWRDENERREATVSRIKATVDILESRPGLSDETLRLADGLEAAKTAYREAEARNKEIAEANAKRESRRAGCREAIRIAQGEIDRLEKRIASKPKTPAPDDVCATCPLMKEWADVPARIRSLHENIATANADLAAIEADETPMDLKPLIEAGEQARAAAKAVDENKLDASRLETERANLNRALHAVADHGSNAPSEETDPAAEINALQAKIDAVADAETRKINAWEAEQTLQIKWANHRQFKTDLEAAKISESERKQAADDARKALADKEATRQELKAAIGKLSTDLEAARADEREAVQMIARLEAEIANLEKQRDETEAKRTQAKELRIRQSRLKKWVTAFAPPGIPALLIDHAAPMLEADINDILEAVAPGRFIVRIVTQVVNQNGTRREDFKIMVQDAAGEREIGMYSGGEKRMIQTAVRLGVMRFAARLYGQVADCIRMDETFDALDADNADNMIAMLGKLETQAERVIVVTHDAGIAARMPSVVRIEKRFGGAVVTVEGNKEKEAVA